ncbi:MAG: PLP-dependent aminotransferase family protein [Sulfolobus sp.]
MILYRLKESELLRLFKLITQRKNIINFVNGMPDNRTIPTSEINEIIRDIIARYSTTAFQYSATCGTKEIKNSLLKLLKHRGIKDITEENICITVGAQEAIYLLFTLLIRNRILMEVPTYISALETARIFNTAIIGVPITPEKGYNLDVVERIEAGKVSLYYTISTAHNPTGYTLSLLERQRLLDLAISKRFFILEDDTYGFLSFDYSSPPAIKSLDSKGIVIYIGTASKILSPGLRVGWIVASENIIHKVELLKQHVNAHSPTLNQLIVSEFIERGLVYRNIARAREIYKKKMSIMKEAIDKYMSDKVVYIPPSGGMFFFLWSKINTEDKLENAINKGVAYLPGRAFYPDGSGSNTLRLSYGFPKEDEIKTGIEKLSTVLF